MAALAMIGLRSSPKIGYSTPAANGTPRRLLAEREEKILADVTHGRPAEPTRPDDAAEITLHEDDTGALHGHVRARAHRDSHVRLREGGSVVDPVARHRNDVPFGRDALDHFTFL